MRRIYEILQEMGRWEIEGVDDADFAGQTRTPATERDIGEQDFGAVRDRQAVKRTLEPADTAKTVSFLASDDADMISGQSIRVDGGLVTL
ncbi:MAG: SDR family oxidoreductase [Solirubrobacterales bacterium]